MIPKSQREELRRLEKEATPGPGTRIGKLALVRRVENSRDRHIQFLVRCDCGEEYKTSLRVIRRSKTQSCKACAQIKATAEQRFWPKVNKTESCWLWTGAIRTDGYGAFRLNGKPEMAHRFSHTVAIGPIQDGYEVDHLCKVQLCVNPSHLEAVTPYENKRRSDSPSAINLRKTHCKHGHPFSGDNVYYRRTETGRKNRSCKTCQVRTTAARKENAR